MKSNPDLFISLCQIPSDSGKESDIITFLSQYLDTQHIPYTTGPYGMITQLKSTSKTKRKGILLSAHLDSDVGGDTDMNYDIETDSFIFSDVVRFDDKTGVFVLLSCMMCLYRENIELDFDVVFYFSVMEEVGQKGAFQLPVEYIEGVRFGIVVDRMSLRHPEGVRHFVDRYMEIPLCPLDDEEMVVRLLNHEGSDIGGISSRFCSDALEFRMKYDVGVVLPEIVKQNTPFTEALIEVQLEYWDVHQRIAQAINELPLDQRVSGFGSGMRKERTDIVKRMNSILYSGDIHIPDELLFSVINLSLDYDAYGSSLPLAELEETTEIILRFIHNYRQIANP
eukprot:TRINITY_DN1182_c0_g1_i1.p1 TRINITY_DN1182_c0_g1~~TRINITY_DN1182_c0_g1_i1.p1  ORF type:complete len:347 (+),score=68.49 TRINITY_DN1182_c0_g1_i1:30-1043(+)